VIFRETFTAPALSVGIISVKTDLDLNLKFFIPFAEFSFHQFVRRINLSLNLSVKVRDEVQNVFVKSFQSKSGLLTLLKISLRCRR